MSEDARSLVLNARRLSVAAVLALGYGYYRMSGGSAALAAIGLIAFAGVAQVLPAMLGGHVLARRDAGRRGGWGWSRALRSGPYAVPAVLRCGLGAAAAVLLTDGPFGHRLAASAGPVRDRGHGPAGACAVLVAVSERAGFFSARS
jgi:Na+/proline symporter